MKALEIQSTGKTIMLGIFTTKTYKLLKGQGFIVFGQFGEMIQGDGETDSLLYRGLIGRIHRACKLADRIVFVLDDIEFPINPDESVTCAELELVCKFETLYNKTIFVRGEDVVKFDRLTVLN